MRFAFVADIHYPKYGDLFEANIDQLRNIDMLFFLGDIILKGDYKQLRKVLNIVRKVYKGPIYGCYGNEEYTQVRKFLRGVKWLDDEGVHLTFDNKDIFVVGTTGSLDKPTPWQKKNIKNIEEIYSERIKKVERLLRENTADYKIVISHYSPTYKTMYGERRMAYPFLGSKKFEGVIKKTQPYMWVHGHCHESKVLETKIGNTRIVNASLPARKKIFVTEISKGLKDFL